MHAAASMQLQHDKEEERRWKRVDEEFTESKPWSRANLSGAIIFVAGFIGITCGLLYGSAFISKIFFAIVFGIALAIAGLLPAILVEAVFGSDRDARRKYKEKRQAVYDRLFPD